MNKEKLSKLLHHQTNCKMENQNKILKMGKDKLADLGEMIEQHEMALKHLQQNSTEVKSNIHSKMSRLLELLRSRELWLLGQVDVIHQLEQDLLRGQMGILSKEATRLNTCMELLEKGKASSDILMGVLKRSSDMEKLTHKLETRYMSFGDDFGAIRKAIVDYGTIDPKVRSCDVDMDNICEGFEDLNWLEQTNGEIPHDFADIAFNTKDQDGSYHFEPTDLSEYDRIVDEYVNVLTEERIAEEIAAKDLASQSKSQEDWFSEDGSKEEERSVNRDSASEINPLQEYMEKMKSFPTGHWLSKDGNDIQSPSKNPLEKYLKEMGAQTWLSPNSTNKENKSETTVNPLQKYLEEIKSLPNERWLLASDDQSPLKKSAKCPLEKYSRDISALTWLAPESRSNGEENKSETMVNPLQRYREKMDCFPTEFWLQSTIPAPDCADEARVPMLHDPNGLVFITGQEKVQIEKEIKSQIRSMQGVTHPLQKSNHGVVVSSEAFKADNPLSGWNSNQSWLVTSKKKSDHSGSSSFDEIMFLPDTFHSNFQ